MYWVVHKQVDSWVSEGGGSSLIPSCDVILKQRVRRLVRDPLPGTDADHRESCQAAPIKSLLRKASH